MGRAPCCEKMGLKKGPWTADEDLVLINYINSNGHDNWRALPKRAGLLRCGKSCRLRWMNYLRPDIKRGNFTREEEETIIRLHQELGNRWSLIAASLPGRTDKIKNVWHTHLKKRLNRKYQPEPEPKPETQTHTSTGSSDFMDSHDSGSNSPVYESSSDVSLATTSDGGAAKIQDSTLPATDDSFWTEVFTGDDSSATSEFWAGNLDSFTSDNFGLGSNICTEVGMDYWYDLLNRADGLIELPQF